MKVWIEGNFYGAELSGIPGYMYDEFEKFIETNCKHIKIDRFLDTIFIMVGHTIDIKEDSLFNARSTRDISWKPIQFITKERSSYQMTDEEIRELNLITSKYPIKKIFNTVKFGFSM